MADKRLVISIFDAEADADAAADALRNTGAVVDDAIGILVLDEHGELKTHKVGPTSGGKAAVGVLADPDELVAAESILLDRGGETTAHAFDAAVLSDVADGAGR